MTLIVRAAQPHDADRLTELVLRSKAHWGYDDVFMAATKDELTIRPDDIGPSRFRVAVDNGVVVGVVSLEGEPPEGALEMLFVEPSAMGKGVGRLLYDDTISLARRLGFERLTIDADPYAEPFYLRMGARTIGTTPSGSIPGRELPLMEVRLRAQGAVAGR